MIYQYNDYELLYLISEHNEEALEIMFSKYKPLIKARIRGFKIKPNVFEDFYQEGLMILYHCIDKYNDIYQKSFNKYFDFYLQKRFMNILKDDKKYFYNTIILEDLDYLCEDPKPYLPDPINLECLSELEKAAYELRYVKKNNIKEISIMLGVDIKIVYNALSRAKGKLKNNDCQG